MSSILRAIRKSYGWKSPIESTKHGQTSIILWLVAAFFFLARIFWPIQIIKTIVRIVRGANAPIPPICAELYIIGSITIELAVLSCAHKNVVLWYQPSVVSALLAAGKICESLSSDLYYLVFRPVLERDPPHNLYRSTVLAVLGFVEVWLLLCILWFYGGSILHGKDLPQSVLDTIYFTTVTFFTLGYGEWLPGNSTSKWLVIFTMFTYFTAFVLVIGRAMAIVAPLPGASDPPCAKRKKPVLLFVFGAPGAGKSTLSERIARDFGFLWLNSDALHDAFDDVDRTSAAYQSRREAVFDGLRRIAIQNLTVGNSVLIDAPHTRAVGDSRWCDRIRDLTLKTSSELRMIRCYCTENVLRQRLTSRGLQRDREKVADDDGWQAFLRTNPVWGPSLLSHLSISTEEDMDANLAVVREFLRPTT